MLEKPYFSRVGIIKEIGFSQFRTSYDVSEEYITPQDFCPGVFFS